MLNNLFKKRWFVGIILVSSFLTGFVLSLVGMTIFNAGNKSSITTSKAYLKATPAPLNKNNPEKGVYNVLLLGYGGGAHEGTYLTDSIIVIHVNTNNNKATMISIPRDLWVPGNKKVNSVAAFQGFQNVGPMITNVTGLPMNYYVSVDFSNFVSLIDNLGGITVNVPQTFDDPYYPIVGQEDNTCGMNDAQIFELKNKFGQSGFELERQFTCRYEHLHFNAGQVKIDGTTALKFVRSRHGDSDFGRSRRQFAVLEGVGQKLIALRSINKFDQTVSTLFGMVHTDLSLGTIKSLIQVFGDPNLYKVNNIQLTTENVLMEGFASDGEYVLMPKAGDLNFTEVKTFINSNL